MVPEYTKKVDTRALRADNRAVEEYRQYLESIGYPQKLLDVECAWASQQRPGAVALIVKCLAIIQEWKESQEDMNE
jgi:hypothetical protein